MTAAISEFSCLTLRLYSGPRWTGDPSHRFSAIFGTSSTASHLSRSLLLRVCNMYVMVYPCVSGKGIDQVVQAERVRLLSPMRGSLLQVNTSGSTSSVQVKNNSGLVIGDEVGALQPPHVVPCSSKWFWHADRGC